MIVEPLTTRWQKTHQKASNLDAITAMSWDTHSTSAPNLLALNDRLYMSRTEHQNQTTSTAQSCSILTVRYHPEMRILMNPLINDEMP